MTHDKFCIEHGGGGDGVTVGSPCYCDMIAAIRADEREQIMQIISDRYVSLITCEEHDDCKVKAQGALLARCDIVGEQA